ncbi:MAG: hypothetical protein MI739_12775 [Bacteroidales bacterium]|nr:hypothetical protein [Bacteroidales bacterium]
MKKLLLILIPIFLISCSESKLLLKSLNQFQAPLNYVHDSKIINHDKSAKLAIKQTNFQSLNTLTSVSKINHKLFPFIIYNYEEINLAVKLGQSSLQENYPDFFKNAFATESERTGCYLLSDNINESDYSLEITCDTCKVESKYQRNCTVVFLLFAYSMSFQEIGFPAETNLLLNVKLNKGDNLVFEKKYQVYTAQPFLNVQRRNQVKLRADFVTNMAESLSLSTKNGIEQMIADINNAIKKNSAN